MAIVSHKVPENTTNKSTRADANSGQNDTKVLRRKADHQINQRALQVWAIQVVPFPERGSHRQSAN